MERQSNTTSVPPEQKSSSRQVRRAQERREFKMLRSAVKRQAMEQKRRGGSAPVGRPSA